jgi:type III restriction enzyme
LEYWTDPGREKKLFFCQIEARETAIYTAEVAKKAGDNWIDNDLRKFNTGANPELFRIALKPCNPPVFPEKIPDLKYNNRHCSIT